MNYPLLFVAKKSLATLLTPPLLPWLLVLLGLTLQRRAPRWGKGMLVCGVLLGLALSTPLSVRWLAAPLEQIPPVSQADLGRAQAIVVLGGGQRSLAPEYGAAAPNRWTLERLRYAARLAHQSSLPVLVSGGAPTGRQAEAEAMAQSLRADFTVTPRWIEAQSLDTTENARYSAVLLRAAGIRRIALVTHALHMPRALAAFRSQGLEVIAAPTGYAAQGTGGEEWTTWLPNMSSAQTGAAAVHEWLGLFAQGVVIPPRP